MELLHVHHLTTRFYDFTGTFELLLQIWRRGKFSIDIAREIDLGQEPKRWQLNEFLPVESILRDSQEIEIG